MPLIATALGSARRNTPVVVCGALFSGFAGAHLIDEFVWGAPAEFHLSVVTAELLSLVFLSSLVGLVVAAAMGRCPAFLGLAIIGALITLADTLKHGVEIAEPGVWRSGPVSEGLAIGLTLAALMMAWTSWAAYRQARRTEVGGDASE